MEVIQPKRAYRFLTIFLFLIAITQVVDTVPANNISNDDVGELFAAYIVQGQDVASIAESINEAGGIVTHDLDIINAVGALLTIDQFEALQADEQINDLWADNLVTIATADQTVRDEFNNRSFDNNDGILNWSDTWLEIGEQDGPASGMVQVNDSSYNEPQCASGDCLRLGGHTGGTFGVSRAVNLQGASSATLTFSWRREQNGGYVASDNIDLDISRDGGISWDLLSIIPTGEGQTTQQQMIF